MSKENSSYVVKREVNLFVQRRFYFYFSISSLALLTFTSYFWNSYYENAWRLAYSYLVINRGHDFYHFLSVTFISVINFFV